MTHIAIDIITGEVTKTPLTQQEIDEGRYLSELEKAPLILAQIATLEGKTERGVREFMLTVMEKEAVTLGSAQGLTAEQSLALAYASNILYRKAKDVDTAIAALRAQL